jgi:hypothetical protein
MKIELVIGIDTLGDVNTDADNLRYAEAVEAAITEEYPDAHVCVLIGEYSICEVDGFGANGHDVCTNLGEIKNRVWDAANY